jgi:hypothetical protein
VGEASWLAGTSIDGNTDIDDISNVTEELVEICVGHLEGEIADEESLGGGVLSPLALCPVHVVDDEAAALEDGLVLGFDGGGGLFDAFEFDVAESVSVILATELFKLKNINEKCSSIPFAQSSGISGNGDTLDVSKLFKLSL